MSDKEYRDGLIALLRNQGHPDPEAEADRMIRDSERAGEIVKDAQSGGGNDA